MARALLCTARMTLTHLIVLAALAADPITAKFTVPDGDPYQVVVRQGGKQLPCPAAVTAERPCELQLEKGPATVVATGSPSFEFDYAHTVSTRHELSFRRTWPKWVGATLVVVSAASFALASLKYSKCGGTSLSDKSECRNAYVGLVFGIPLLSLGLPALIYGLFTGNRTVSDAL